MWYKIAKSGYIDVQKYIEDGLGYELNFNVDEYLKYIIVNSANSVGNNMVVNFDKLNTQLQNSPFNSFVSGFAAIDPNDESGLEGAIGSYEPETKNMFIIPQFPKFMIPKMVDVLLHEFAHALDPGMNKRKPDKPYSKHNIMNILPYVINNINQFKQSSGRMLSKEQIWSVFIEIAVKEKFGANLPESVKAQYKEDVNDILSKDKDAITDNILAILSNNVVDEKSADDFVQKEYLNQRVEAPAQLLSLHRESMPSVLLNYCATSLLAFLMQRKPNLLQILGVTSETNAVEVLRKIKEKSPGFIDSNMKQKMMSIVKEELFTNIQNSDILQISKDFVLKTRRKHEKRQIYKILNDNVTEFKKLVDEL